MGIEIALIITPGLGDNSYVLSVDGEAAAVDPQRDVERLIAAAVGRGARIRYALETHLHNDYISGAAELRASSGAEIVGPADAAFGFPYRPVREGDAIELAGVRLVAMASPGHTPEHTSYLVYADGEDPVAVFSGGSLIVGGAGRTDLLGRDRADELARAQFTTMRRFAALPDDVAVLPTHGAGSFCAAPSGSGARTSTLGVERASNVALTTADEDRFADAQLRDLPPIPAYFARMAPINRDGPPVLGGVPSPAPVSADDVARAIDDGAWLVDTRDGPEFARAHVTGSLNVPLEATFGTYVGWLVPPEAPLYLVVEDDAAIREAATQLMRIGVDRVAGVLDGGIDAWTATGRDVASYPTISVEELAADVRAGAEMRGTVLDVRQPQEWDAGHLDRSRHVFVADVQAAIPDLDRDQPTTVICASGYRSSMAASLLDRAGVPVRLVSPAGVPRLLETLAR